MTATSAAAFEFNYNSVKISSHGCPVNREYAKKNIHRKDNVEIPNDDPHAKFGFRSCSVCCLRFQSKVHSRHATNIPYYSKKEVDLHVAGLVKDLDTLKSPIDGMELIAKTKLSKSQEEDRKPPAKK